MNIALDIDGTITQQPTFFAVLSLAIRASGGKVFIVTSRANTTDVKTQTRRELKSYGIEYDELVIIADAKEERRPCPHDELDWYNQYLWQKVAVCLERDVVVVFEDDSKVIDIFLAYAPSIQVFRVEGRE